jgi:hypothetical protein
VGFNFLKQTGTAIRYGGWQSLTAVGTRIEMDGPGPAIVTLRSSSKLGGGGKVVVDGRTEYHSMNGQLNLIDSVITFQKPGDHVAIEAAATVHLNNVYMKNAKAMCRFREDGETLAGVDDGWARVGQYTHAVDPGRVRPYPHQPPVLVFPYTSSIFVDGKKLTGKTLGDPVEKGPTPPTDLQSRHVWDGDFPSWETPGAVNVRCAPYLAKGDAKSDDYATLQKAVDENEIVFLPRGVYCLSQTLKLKPNTKLIGLTNHTTHLVAGIPGQVDCAFTTATTAMPTVESADAADADTVLAFMRVRGAGINGYCLKWQAGRKSVVRSVEFRVSRQAVVPSVVVANNGGGKWYNYHHGETVKTKEPGYRRLLVENTREPLAFYMFNLEHAYYQEAHAEFRNAKNVFLYGTKGETYNTLLWFRDCDNVAVFGNAGNSNSLNSPAIFRIENTPNFMLVNLVDRTRKAKHYNWHMLAEEADGETILTEPLERPALYQRGTVTRR